MTPGLGVPGVGIDVSDRHYFKAHSDGESRDLLVSDPVISRVDGKWTWVLSVPVRDDAGGLIAVAAVSLDARYLSDLVEPRQLANTEVRALVFGDDRLLGISDQEWEQMGSSLQGLPEQPEPGNWNITRNQKPALESAIKCYLAVCCKKLAVDSCHIKTTAVFKCQRRANSDTDQVVLDRISAHVWPFHVLFVCLSAWAAPDNTSP